LQNEYANRNIDIFNVIKNYNKSVTSSKTFAYSDRATGELYMPAHPQAHSFLRLSCGALSVPRKNRLLPLVMAETIACPK
jgi:hypothetical protein